MHQAQFLQPPSPPELFSVLDSGRQEGSKTTKPIIASTFFLVNHSEHSALKTQAYATALPAYTRTQRSQKIVRTNINPTATAPAKL